MKRWAPVGVVCLLAHAACSSNEKQFGNAGGGAAGTGGTSDGGVGAADASGAPSEAGSSPEVAGAGGEPPAVACAQDSDCSDGLACNGSETCQDNVCVSGTPPCANPDAKHCDAVCVEANGAASCSVQGQDADKDSHLSSACATKPGDDCDDSDATTYAGAKEICDGVDHNCNGKLAINDGMSLSGTVSEIGVAGKPRSSPSIAWATDKSAYGIVHVDHSLPGTTEGLYFQMLDQAGAITLAQEKVGGYPPYGVSLVWGGDQFGLMSFAGNGVAFQTVSSGGVGGNFLSFDACPCPDIPNIFGLGLARVSGSNWGILFASSVKGVPNRDFVGTASASGVKGTSVPVSPSGIPQGPGSIAAIGSNFVVGYTDASAAAVAIWDATLSTSKPVSVVGKAPILGSGASGFAVALAPAAAGNPPQFYAFGPSGTKLCGPVNLADKSFVPAAIVATPKGYLVASSGALRVQEMLADCAPGVSFTVDVGPAQNVGIAAGDKGYGVVWQDTSANVPKRRFFGPSFCD